MNKLFVRPKTCTHYWTAVKVINLCALSLELPAGTCCSLAVVETRQITSFAILDMTLFNIFSFFHRV